MFKKGTGNWTQYRGPDVEEVDFHWSNLPFDQQDRRPYWEERLLDRDRALTALKDAHARGVSHVLFTHGWSRRGKETTRSVIRKLMHSKEATPYIIRCQRIQHESVFRAAIRPPK